MLAFLFSQKTILTVGIVVLVAVASHVLLRKRQFILHGVVLSLFGIGTVILFLAVDGYALYYGNFLLFATFYFAAVDHYWARRNVGEAVISLEKARKIKVIFAAIFTAWTVLAYMDLPFFSTFQRSSLVSAATLLWLDYALFKGKDTRKGTPFSQN